SNVLAVEVVRLDAGGEVDDPKSIVVIDDRGSRSDEIPVEYAAFAPDEVGVFGRAAAGDECKRSQQEESAIGKNLSHESLPDKVDHAAGATAVSAGGSGGRSSGFSSSNPGVGIGERNLGSWKTRHISLRISAAGGGGSRS